MREAAKTVSRTPAGRPAPAQAPRRTAPVPPSFVGSDSAAPVNNSNIQIPSFLQKKN